MTRTQRAAKLSELAERAAQFRAFGDIPGALRLEAEVDTLFADPAVGLDEADDLVRVEVAAVLRATHRQTPEVYQ